ncbi:hypothetical protein SAMN04489759_101250 [Sulfitobacter delicatus]|uniref:Uncharacterized protein n=1 Tax=Sulfitobacter delicatus TaxID=218672 RepID=A0A1G7HY41_9RHOB|nr:hypothetical protein SAMN04489759_101250 [Sulfitobacter delicatus]
MTLPLFLALNTFGGLGAGPQPTLATQDRRP